MKSMRLVLFGIPISCSAGLFALALILPVEPPALVMADGRPEDCLDHGQGFDSPFISAFTCAQCHSAATRAVALRSPLGHDISPHGLWEGSMMANSFHDPFWRAQVALEQSLTPEGAPDPSSLCVRCHAPIAYHDHVLAGKPEPGLAIARTHKFADDGVNCTVCHQIPAEGLGEEQHFDGRIKISKTMEIFGPHQNPALNPMSNFSGYTPTFGPHVQKAELCAGCHTLRTQHAPDSELFPEQTPFLEWRNSVYAREGAEAKTCQDCHMPDLGAQRLARNPGGGDFILPPRPHFAAHTFTGANAYMLQMMAENAEALGLGERVQALLRNASATRLFLWDQTARLEVLDPVRAEGRLKFRLRIENLAGHKLPTGYPARRLVLGLSVRAGRTIHFESGSIGDDGRIQGVKDEHALPHVREIRSPEDVLVYESVALDATGAATTSLMKMASRRKDNRILPKGWLENGPDAASTRPVGVEGDTDFAPGQDEVLVDVPLPDDVRGRVVIVATLRLQTVPPTWVDPLRPLEHEEAKRFVTWYDERPDDGAIVAFKVHNMP